VHAQGSRPPLINRDETWIGAPCCIHPTSSDPSRFTSRRGSTGDEGSSSSDRSVWHGRTARGGFLSRAPTGPIQCGDDRPARGGARLLLLQRGKRSETNQRRWLAHMACVVGQGLLVQAAGESVALPSHHPISLHVAAGTMPHGRMHRAWLPHERAIDGRSPCQGLSNLTSMTSRKEGDAWLQVPVVSGISRSHRELAMRRECCSSP
jgi:hypothetical protein